MRMDRPPLDCQVVLRPEQTGRLRAAQKNGGGRAHLRLAVGDWSADVELLPVTPVRRSFTLP